MAMRRSRPPGPVTAAWLERVALHYLDRYAASTEMLRRTLARRVAKRAQARGEPPEAHAETVEMIVARAIKAGLVDDARFAAARLATLRRRGASARSARAALAARGVDRETVASTLAGERHEAGEERDAESVAAWTYARRRRLGPFRPAETRAEHRERDLAAMARAGFSFGIALAAIDADPEDSRDSTP